MLERLRQIPLFAQFPQQELEILLKQSQILDLAAGEFIFHDGDAPTGFFVILSGELEISKVLGGQTIILANEGTGSFVGEISILTGQRRTASARATTDTQLLEFHAQVVESVRSTPLAELLLSKMAQRLRDTEAHISQQEKLSALGKLAAGLAHELNNPASANVRAARQIPGMLSDLQRLSFSLHDYGLTAEQIALLDDLGQQLIMQPAPEPLSALALNDQEAKLLDWLDDHHIANSWKIAPALAAERLGVDVLEMLAAKLPAEALPAALHWIENTLTMIGLARTVAQSATRISEMIQAVKAYTYMDEAPIQNVDIHDGIESTLAVLTHRLGKITIQRAYDRTCPKISVYASEVNEVWTKLFENAIDAMPDGGTLTIQSECSDNYVYIEIIDTGRGVPAEVQSRIFEPFFSTKPMGTGLGLDIARRIVVDRHHGSLRFTSKQGDTHFIVALPLVMET